MTLLVAAVCPARVTVEVQLIPLDTSVVAAARSGLIATVKVEQGQAVAEGDLAAELDSGNARLEAERAKTEVSVARKKAEDDIPIRHATKTRDLARTELARAQSINRRAPGSVAQREIDALMLTSERADLAIEQAKQEREVAALELELKEIASRIAELNVSQHQLRAPVAGVVVEVHKRAGEWVESGDGVLEVTPTNLLRAEGFLDPSSAAKLRRGAPAMLQIETPGGRAVEVEGRVVFVSPDANPVNGSVRVRAEFQRDGLPLRPGMAGVVTIEAEAEAGDPATDNLTQRADS